MVTEKLGKWLFDDSVKKILKKKLSDGNWFMGQKVSYYLYENF